MRIIHSWSGNNNGPRIFKANSDANRLSARQESTDRSERLVGVGGVDRRRSLKSFANSEQHRACPRIGYDPKLGNPPRTRFSCFLTGPKQPTSARGRAIMDENGGGPFAMRRCQAALTSCARRLAATRSRPSRPPRSTKRLGSSASPRRSPIRPESGCPRNGRCVRSRRPRTPRRMGAALTYARGRRIAR